MRTARATPLCLSGRGTHGLLQLHRRLLQSHPAALRPGVSLAHLLRTGDANRPTIRHPLNRPPKRGNFKLTPRSAAWTVLRREERRSTQDREVLAELRQYNPELDQAIELAEEFAALVRRREPGHLDPWLQRAQDGTVVSLRRFAKRLLADYNAVRAAVTLGWSNGPVEGQINRLKMLKRTMYGRADLDLLSRRFLLAA